MNTECCDPKNGLTCTESTAAKRTFKPVADVVESNDGVTLTIDLPGVAEENVDVTLEENVLTVRGRVEPPMFEGMERVVGEFEVGDYERRFTISDKLDHDSIDATLKNGVLTIRLLRAKAAGAKKVVVKAV